MAELLSNHIFSKEKTVELHLLQAHEGDFIWLRFGEGLRKNNIIIDGGTEETATLVKNTLEHILGSGEDIDALFITHIDADHLLGMANGMELLTCPLEGRIKAIYMNTHRAAKKMTGTASPEGIIPVEEEKIITPYSNVYSPGHAISFLDFLKKKNLLTVLNEYTVMGQTIQVGNASLYVISPGIDEMKAFVKEYERRAPKDKSEIYGGNIPPVDTKNLNDYSQADLKKDTSRINRSSMAFLFVYDKYRLLLLGDSAADVCLKGKKCFPTIMGEKCPVDAFKISHHGSRYNTSEELLQVFPTDCYLLSTNGINPNGKADVPHRAVIAQILKSRSSESVNLVCNYPWWELTYGNRYFTNSDAEEFLCNGILRRVNLQKNFYEKKNGLKIYGGK